MPQVAKLYSCSEPPSKFPVFALYLIVTIVTGAQLSIRQIFRCFLTTFNKNPIYVQYSFSENCTGTALVPISTFMCL